MRDGETIFEPGLSRRVVMRPGLGLEQGGGVPGLLQGELRMGRIGAARHVVLDEANGAREAVHAGAVVVAVGAPEWRELVAASVGRGPPTLAEPVGLMT